MHWQYLLILMIPLAVWILGNLFKEAEEPVKGRPRNQSDLARSRRPPTDVDRFLAQRRQRRTEPERTPDPVTQPFPQPERQRERPSQEQPRRAEQQRPQGSPRPTSREPNARPTAPPRLLLDQPETPRAQAEPITLELARPAASAPPTARPAAPAQTSPAPATAPTELQKPNVAPKITSNEPALPPLGQLLRSPKSARLAFILREIIDPPLCRRPRRPHHG